MHMHSWRTAVCLAAVLLFAASPARAQQRAPRSSQSWRVLEPQGGRPLAAADGRPGMPVAVRLDLLAQAATLGGIVELTLAPGLTVRAEIEWTGSAASDVFVAGRLLDGLDGDVSLTVVGDTLVGRVTVGPRLFMIRRAVDSPVHVSTEMPADAFPAERQPRVVPGPGAPLAAPPDQPTAQADTNEFVDLLIVYTPAARAQMGGTSAIETDLVGAVNNANTALANANVTHRFRLVRQEEIAYTEYSDFIGGDIEIDLDRLDATADGFLDSVHTLRNTHAADVVTLVTNSTDLSCGVGFLMGPSSVNNSFESSAFNVVEATCANGNLTLAHEIGHNMGLHHDRANASSLPAFSYAYGYGVNGVGRDVMAYACPNGTTGSTCPRRTIFSTPLRNFPPALTTPAGTSTEDNARALNGTSLVVANFRQYCAYALSAASWSMGPSAGVGTVGVTTPAGCAWTAVSNSAFITVTGGASGTGNGIVSYSVTAHPSGVRSGTMTIGGRTFTLTQGPLLTTNRSSLSFGAINAAGALSNATSAQIIRVSFTGGTSTWLAQASAPWIQVTGPNGSGNGQFTVRVVYDPSLPAGGTVTGQVVVYAGGAANAPQVIPIRLTLFASTTTATAPVGSFDTPAHLVTELQGSFAVTGWALDDIEVSRVEIWRDVASGETTTPFNLPGHPGHGKIFIANAFFVAGARPDVEAAYGTTPLAYRAGWGYLLLSWGLWAQGNGSYNLYAFAYDNDNHVSTLGTKTISVNNAAANRPFGGIDVPSYGQVMSAPFWNYGWALTPNVNGSPSCTIANPNVQVSIDSGPLVAVTYGGARSDIALAFPGFSNSLNAGGAYYLNTAALTNGTHTIGWLVTDSCGRVDGIGSRFFDVSGSASDRPAPSLPTSSTGQAPAIEWAQVYARMSAGAESGPWEAVAPGAEGRRVVSVAQDARVEVQLPSVEGMTYTGVQLVGGAVESAAARRGLPLGSSLDAQAGIFYWQPAAGFLGSYDLQFEGTRTDGRKAVAPVRVVVGPPLRMTIDTPGAGASVSAPFVVAGWALDLAAAEGSGIDTVHVWAYPAAGSAPVFLGVATVGGARPDVAATYGAQFEPAAYDLIVDRLSAGTYDVVVYAHRASTGQFDGAQVVRMVVD